MAGILGEGDSEPPLHQLGVWGNAEPGKFEIWCNLRPQKSLQKYQIKYYDCMVTLLEGCWQCIATGVVCKVLILGQAASGTCASATMRFCDNALLGQCASEPHAWPRSAWPRSTISMVQKRMAQKRIVLDHALLGQCTSVPEAHCPRSALSQKRMSAGSEAHNSYVALKRMACRGRSLLAMTRTVIISFIAQC